MAASPSATASSNVLTSRSDLPARLQHVAPQQNRFALILAADLRHVDRGFAGPRRCVWLSPGRSPCRRGRAWPWPVPRRCPGSRRSAAGGGTARSHVFASARNCSRLLLGEDQQAEILGLGEQRLQAGRRHLFVRDRGRWPALRRRCPAPGRKSPSSSAVLPCQRWAYRPVTVRPAAAECDSAEKRRRTPCRPSRSAAVRSGLFGSA